MRAKFMIVIVLALLLGVALLDLRQQRIDAMHEMTTVHRKMNDDRKAIWKHQARIAEQVHPDRLRESIERMELDLEPITR